jgi:hypothetical protein
MEGDEFLEDLPVAAEGSERLLLVLCHQPAVSRDVRREDGREFAFEVARC